MTPSAKSVHALPPKRVVVLYTSRAASPTLPEKIRQAEDLTGNAQTVACVLRGLGHTVRCVDFGTDLRQLISRLRSFRAEIVFNLAEGPLAVYEKEPHAVALLELLGLPYTGNGPLALTLCKDKAFTKQILQWHALPTPAFQVYSVAPKSSPELVFPLVVKPLREDGSLGITERSLAENPAQLRRAVALLLQEQGQEALVEEFLCGREFNVSVLGNGTPKAPYRVLPPGEFLYHSLRWRVCTFDAKWDRAHPSYAAVEAVCPARISAVLRRQLVKVTTRCARIFGLNGYARLDFRLDKRGGPQLFDVNPNPDLAPGMGIACAAAAAGMSYAEFVQEILWLGWERGAR
jgi:D-alanine-D-alanine ligase